MTVMERLELVLKDHRVSVHVGTPDMEAAWMNQSLMTALMSCVTQVTRKQLNDLFAAHECKDKSKAKGQSELMEAILRLMHGEPESQRWCPHLTWRVEDGGYWLYEDTTENPHHCRHKIRPHDDWDQCPVAGCHAPRPKMT